MGMIPELRQLFHIQIVDQCRIILLEEHSIDNALILLNQNVSFANDLTWAHIQNLMNAANNVSKALWGQQKDENPEVVQRRRPLRTALGITDKSPFYDVRMRNNFEHFDNRLDNWSKSNNRVFVDKQIGPSHLVAGQPLKSLFRFFNPETWELGFWGQRFDVRAICTEARRLMPPLEEDDYAGLKPPEGWDEIRKVAEIWSPNKP